jgi:hypothetical protein
VLAVSNCSTETAFFKNARVKNLHASIHAYIHIALWQQESHEDIIIELASVTARKYLKLYCSV